MLKVGLTGGIGAGKTTISTIFKILGVPVFDADKEAKIIMNNSNEIKEELIKIFGKEVYKENVLNKKYLANIVFNDKEKLKVLNSIVHPITIQAFDDWSAHQNSSYVIKEAALLFESGSNKDLDYTIGVFAPKELRIKRVQNRDNISSIDVEKRIHNQMDEEAVKKFCDFIFINDEQQMILPQAIALHHHILMLK